MSWSTSALREAPDNDRIDRRKEEKRGLYLYAICQTWPVSWRHGAGVLGGADAQSADWPMWRHDSHRSAVSLAASLSKGLHLHWTRELGPQRSAWPEDHRLQFDRVYEPIVLARAVFIGSTRTDSILAVDTRTGEQRWRFFAEGPIRFAPVGLNSRIYFGADDGYFYCLEAETGKVVWKYNAAPNARKAIGNERLISVWPIRGGPIHANGKIYFTAGMW